MIFDTLEEAEAYRLQYQSAPDRTVGPVQQVQLADGTYKYQITIRWWGLD
jgi:hypothetical protein